MGVGEYTKPGSGVSRVRFLFIIRCPLFWGYLSCLVYMSFAKYFCSCIHQNLPYLISVIRAENLVGLSEYRWDGRQVYVSLGILVLGVACNNPLQVDTMFTHTAYMSFKPTTESPCIPMIPSQTLTDQLFYIKQDISTKHSSGKTLLVSRFPSLSLRCATEANEGIAL